jgi:hypothetical protein
VASLKRAGTHVLIATIGWRFAAELLQQRHGFTAVSGTGFAIRDGVVTGTVSRYFDAHDKLRFAEGWCAQNGWELADVAAVGDSRSDLPRSPTPRMNRSTHTRPTGRPSNGGILHRHNTGPKTGANGETIPATGKRVRARECDVATVKNGVVTSHWFYFDMRDWLEQLGLPGQSQA